MESLISPTARNLKRNLTLVSKNKIKVLLGNRHLTAHVVQHCSRFLAGLPLSGAAILDLGAGCDFLMPHSRLLDAHVRGKGSTLGGMRCPRRLQVAKGAAQAAIILA